MDRPGGAVLVILCVVGAGPAIRRHYVIHLMVYALAAIIAFGIFQFFWSIRLAYRLERYQLAAGYPILGHVLHTVCIILICAALVPKDWQVRQMPSLVRVPIVLACFALPFVHGWLLVRYTKRGEEARFAATGGGG